ncbi:MAG: PA2169 family four-helix-bundle protein, partial [Catalinimonas sp.]
TSGTLLGDLHRTWINVREFFAKKDNKAVVDECIRGEKSALEAYSRALDNKLPAPVRDRLADQFGMIEGAVQQLEEFKQSVSA